MSINNLEKVIREEIGKYFLMREASIGTPGIYFVARSEKWSCRDRRDLMNV